MDLNDVSLSSVEDEKFSVTSIMEYESSHENRDIPVSNIKTSAPNNDQCLHRHDKTRQSSEVTKKPKIKDKSLRVQESSPSVSKIGEDSASNISLKVGNGNLKTSQTMLQFTDFEATCGSSSFNRMSSEIKLSVDFQVNSEKCASSLEKPLLELPPTPVENTSISSFTISSDVGLNREYHSTNCIISGFEGSSLTEDCNEAISLDMNNRFNIPPPLPKGRLCNFHMAEKLRSILEISSTLASDGALHNEEMSSNKNTITALGKTYFLNTREDETLPYDCNGQNYCYKENKSVRRRKFKTEPPISETNSLPTRSSMPSVSNSSRKAGRSLLQLCKSLEETSPEEEDWDIYENYGRSGEVKYFTSKPWEKELLYFCYQMENAYAFPQMGTERLLKEVNNFFRNNHVDADENLNWKEMKNRIVTSKYFSDEFCRSLGILTKEELEKEFPIFLERSRAQDLKHMLELKGLCKALIECGISEEHFIRNFAKRLCDAAYKMSLISEPTNREQGYDDRRLFHIEKEFGYELMRDLFRKFMRGDSYQNLLCVTQNVFENSSQDPQDSSAGNQNTIYSHYPPLNRTISPNELGNVDCSSGSKESMPQIEQKSVKLPQVNSKESKETSEVVSSPDSNALDSSITTENELFNTESPFAERMESETLESKNEPRNNKDGSLVSAEDLDSIVDKSIQ